MPRCKVQNYITVDGRVTVDIELPSIFSFVWKRVYYSECGTFKIYETDDLGRVKRVSGELELGKLGSNNYQQGKSVSLKDGTKGVDQGGHLVAHPFKGAGEQINYVPMKGYVPPRIRKAAGTEKTVTNKVNEGNAENRLNDAEQTILREAKEQKANIEDIGATRDMCHKCQEAFAEEQLLDRVSTPLKK